MDDDFLTAAILNWDEPTPASAPLLPAPRATHIDLFVVLSVLYVLAALVLGVRWYHARSR